MATAVIRTTRTARAADERRHQDATAAPLSLEGRVDRAPDGRIQAAGAGVPRSSAVASRLIIDGLSSRSRRPTSARVDSRRTSSAWRRRWSALAVASWSSSSTPLVDRSINDSAAALFDGRICGDGGGVLGGSRQDRGMPPPWLTRLRMPQQLAARLHDAAAPCACRAGGSRRRRRTPPSRRRRSRTGWEGDPPRPSVRPRRAGRSRRAPRQALRHARPPREAGGWRWWGGPRWAPGPARRLAALADREEGPGARGLFRPRRTPARA